MPKVRLTTHALRHQSSHHPLNRVPPAGSPDESLPGELRAGGLLVAPVVPHVLSSTAVRTESPRVLLLRPPERRSRLSGCFLVSPPTGNYADRPKIERMTTALNFTLRTQGVSVSGHHWPHPIQALTSRRYPNRAQAPYPQPGMIRRFHRFAQS